MVTYLLVKPEDRADGRLDLDQFARSAQLHPELVRRLVALGLLEPARDTSDRAWFTRADLSAVARIQRLRAGLGLNYCALGLVLDLLDRIGRLENALRETRRPALLTPRQAAALQVRGRGRPTWT
jgi:DNA-binding transcriptional MerR regulator